MTARLKFEGEDGIVFVRNLKKELLGEIEEDLQWKCYTWTQASDVRMSGECLREVADKLRELDLSRWGKAK